MPSFPGRPCPLPGRPCPLPGRPCPVSRLAQSCGALSSVVSSSFGPHGAAVLMENAGKVVISRDGAVILSSLHLGDPILRTAVDGVLTFARARGDGAKSGVILLRSLLAGLDRHITEEAPAESVLGYRVGQYSNGSVARRINMLQMLRQLRLNIVPFFEREVIGKYCHKIDYHDEKFKLVCMKFLFTFFTSQFSKLIACKLTKLVVQYLFWSEHEDTLSLIKRAEQDTHLTIFQVYMASLSKSMVIDGFIISRDFKYINKNLAKSPCKIVLWSIPLTENIEEMTSLAHIETTNDDNFMNSILYKNVLLNQALEILQSFKVVLIISSEVFPEWAVASCRRHSMALVDVVSQAEFSHLTASMHLSPVSCKDDLTNPDNHGVVQVSPIHLGTSRFVKIGLNRRQVVVCGPTVTQCNAFSHAIGRSFKHLHTWLQDSREAVNFLCGHHLTNTDTVSDGLCADTVFWCPSGAYVEILTSIKLNESDDKLSLKSDISNRIFSDVLLAIPIILFEKAALSPRNKFIHYYQQCKDVFSHSPEQFIYLFAKDSVQNPFQFFRVLNNALLEAESLIKIDTILYSCRKLKNVLQKPIQ